MSTPAAATASIPERIARVGEAYRAIREELARRVVGQERVLDQFLTCFFAGGHCLLVGVPGLAKTLIIRSLAEVMSLTFSRIQFTPDLLPSDITGSEILFKDPATRERYMKFLPGPIFANILLADEINRTPPKTQAALLEAMEEGQVTIGGVPHPLDRPFFVLATQNPIEQEGTYPLPVAALDRFFFNIRIDYPEREEERQIVRRTLAPALEPLKVVLSREQAIEGLRLVREVRVPEDVLTMCNRIVRLTRPQLAGRPGFVKEYVNWGASPRGVQTLVLAGKARAMLHARASVEPQDVLEIVRPALRHRLIRNYHAEAEGITPDALINRVVRTVRGEPEPSRKAGRWWERWLSRARKGA
ncbi:MAG: AAA family ATPase [Planctomycetes bacterium]|nr:AAA family ATPase [Planctomycetota bacterium]